MTPKDCFTRTIENADSDSLEAKAWFMLALLCGPTESARIHKKEYSKVLLCASAILRHQPMEDDEGETIPDDPRDHEAYNELWAQLEEARASEVKGEEVLSSTRKYTLDQTSFTAQSLALEMVRRQQRNPMCWVHLAQTFRSSDSPNGTIRLLHDKRSVTAIDCLVTALVLDRQNVEAWSELAYFLLTFGDVTAKVGGDAYSHIDCAKMATQLLTTSVPTLMYLAKLFKKQKSQIELFDGTKLTRKEWAMRILELAPSNRDALFALAQELGATGVAKMKSGEELTSLKSLLRCLEVDLLYGPAWLFLANDLKPSDTVKLGGSDVTRLVAATKAASCLPDNASAWFLLASALGEEGKAEVNGKTLDATECCVQAIQLRADNVLAWLQLGEKRCGGAGVAVRCPSAPWTQMRITASTKCSKLTRKIQRHVNYCKKRSRLHPLRPSPLALPQPLLRPSNRLQPRRPSNRLQPRRPSSPLALPQPLLRQSNPVQRVNHEKKRIPSNLLTGALPLRRDPPAELPKELPPSQRNARNTAGHLTL